MEETGLAAQLSPVERRRAHADDFRILELIDMYE